MAHRLKLRSDLHLARKIWHAAGVGAMAILFDRFGYSWAWTFLIAIAVIIVPLDLLRQRRPGLNATTVRLFSPVMRKHEESGMSGMSYLFAGAAILLALFDRHVVTLTLLFLAFGDPVASYCGIRFGKDRIVGNKTLQGSIGAFVACGAIAAIYFYARGLMVERLWIVAPVAGLIGAVAEAIPVGKLDDNLTFPVIAACLLWTLFLLFGS